MIFPARGILATVLALFLSFGLYPCFFLFYGFHCGCHSILTQCFLNSVKVSGDTTEYFVLVCQLVDPITHSGGLGTFPAEPLLQPVIIISQIQKCVVDGAENLATKISRSVNLDKAVFNAS